MARACALSAEAHCIAMRQTKAGVNEWQIGAEIESHFARNGMEPGYGPIVGGGDNACILHYVQHNMALNDGDLLLIDAGGDSEGYTATIPLPVPASGTFSKAQHAASNSVQIGR